MMLLATGRVAEEVALRVMMWTRALANDASGNAQNDLEDWNMERW